MSASSVDTPIVDSPTRMADSTNPLIKQSAEGADTTRGDGLVRCPKRRTDVQTSPIDPRDIRASWPIVIAYLEQMSGWAVLALRLGTLALIQDCVKELAKPDADPDIVAGLRRLVDALAHMPMEA